MLSSHFVGFPEKSKWYRLYAHNAGSFHDDEICASDVPKNMSTNKI